MDGTIENKRIQFRMELVNFVLKFLTIDFMTTFNNMIWCRLKAKGEIKNQVIVSRRLWLNDFKLNEHRLLFVPSFEQCDKKEVAKCL